MLLKPGSLLVKAPGKSLLIALAILLAGGAVTLAQRNVNDSRRWPASRGKMIEARSNACSALLSDGRVLITGGVSGELRLSSAEFYDAAGKFSPAPRMSEARSDHACGVLPDGSLLVAGGRTGAGMTNSTEIFDPKANAWKAGPAMPSSRAGAAFATLKDGRLLLAGGEVAGAISDGLVVFDPETGSFPPVAGRLSSPRRDHAMAVLKDGRVAIAGGFDGVKYVASIDVFDPATGAVTPAGRLSVPRAQLSATTLLDGRVVFLGGSDDRTEYGAAEIWNPKNGSVAMDAAMMAQPRHGHAAVRVQGNNTVLLIGGRAGGQMVAQNEAYVPWKHRFQEAGTLDAGVTAGAVVALRQRGGLLIAGGSGVTGAMATSLTACVPTVQTDKADYAPGTTVTITGSCWQAGGTVTISMTESPDLFGESPITVAPSVVAADGTFVNTTFAPDMNDVGVTFFLTATEAVDAAGAAIVPPLTAQTSFTDALTVSSLSPNSGPTTGGTVVTIVGVGFTSGQDPFTVTFDGISATSVTRIDNLHLSATTPPHAAGAVDVVVMDKGGAPGSTLASGFTYGSKTSQSITFGALGNKVYGDADFAVSATASSGLAVSFTAAGQCSVSGSTVHLTGAGSCTITAHQSGNGTYAAAADVSQTFSIAKATATVVVTPYSVTYDGTAHTATGTVTGVGGALLTGLVLTGTTHTNAGDYAADAWTFTDATGNYNNASGTTHDVIAKATATIAVTPYSVTFDGTAHTATGTVTGVSGEVLTGLVLTGTTHTNAGDYAADAWSFTDSTGNYNNTSGTVHDAIAKANATIAVTPYSVTYDSTEHTATGTAKGVVNESLSGLDLSGTRHTNAGDYAADAWKFTDSTGNYNNANGTTHDSIAKANATLTVTPYSVTYDATEHTATGTAKGVVNEDLSGLDLSGTKHTNAGDYTTDSWSFTDSTGNYNNASGTTHDSIAKANASVVVTPYSVTYDGAAHTASGTATGVGGAALTGLVLTATIHTNAGTYNGDAWTFSNANYNDTSGSVNDSIAKANASIVVTPYSVTYSGAPHTATGTAKGVQNESLSGLDLGATTHTNAGSYNDAWTFTDSTGNYNNASGSTTDAIAKANATIVVTPYSVTYDANAHTATGSAKGVLNEPLGGLDLSGTVHTNAGTFNDAWTFTDSTGNYNNSSATVADVIAKAAATITVSGYNVTYDGNAHTASGTATGVGGADLIAGLHLSGTTHTDAGVYTDGWTFTGGANYQDASGSVLDQIAKAVATIVVTPYSVVYDGAPHTATGGATGVGGAGISGLNLNGTTHTNAGTYNGDAWTFSNVNYVDASGTVNDSIAKANATISVTPYSVTYDGTAHTATGSATGVGGANLNAGLNLSSTSHTNAGDYSSDSWTFTDAVGNYNGASGTVHDSIGKANASISVTAYSVTYDGNAHTATGTATGVGGANLSAGLNVSLTTHSNAGTFTDTWNFADGSGNYNDASGTVNDVIAKANPTVSVTPYSVTYDGNPHTATGTASGIAGAALAGLALGGTTHANAGSYTDTWNFVDVSGNYNNATGTVNDTIAKATATISVTPYTVTYDGNAHTASGSATGIGGAALAGLVLTGTTHTDAGDYLADAWTFHDAAGNYNDASGATHDAIAKATATITVTPYAVTYNGAAHTASGTASGVGGAAISGLDLSGTSHTHAGTYNGDGWTFSNANYVSASGTVNDVIAKARATIVVTGYSVTYDANPHSATGSATGVGGADLSAGLNLASTVHMNAGTYNDPWTFAGGTNYLNTTGSVADQIDKAQTTITITNTAALTAPTAVGQSFAVNWTLAPVTPGGAPTGNVTVTDGSASCSKAAVFGAGTCSVSPTVVGVKTLTVSYAGDGNFSGSSTTFQYVVVYDPNAGFVTGGGWINSPVGAYAANAALTGKANFGFVSKYKKGQSTPDGETEFQFQAAGFSFHSTSYDWLVIAGAKAQFKGSGAINGAGDYAFLLTAIDGQVNGGGGTDKFRMKVWDKLTNAVLYDNQLALADGADPTTLLGGGSIVIHDK